jgi:hypothetical protein
MTDATSTTKAPPPPNTRVKAETKHEITNSTARAIIDAEVRQRDAQTHRLREARLAREAEAPEPAPAKPRAKKAIKTKK